ncbi:flavodoxin family protein [Tepidanaerobacter syntrophicus]|uniref:flavodoxin family protein n=1 Tax=Tepidanaerobacter syntrophicus TaxID=224999 RepID=UPI001BD35319|nr:flavodoxin family protein [Tepidanaerobacter syntrophicus]
MNILVLNGSPKGERSNTLKITKAFLKGLCSKQRHNIDIVEIKTKNIEPCRGCFTCWTKTPGRCVIKDDMGELIKQYIKADLIVWSFPLYYFGMPSKIKAFLDRMLPTNLPYMSINEDGTTGHPPRYDLSHQRYVLISTCGFYTVKNNYDALFRQFEIIFGDKLTKIICPEGELFSVPQLDGKTSEYLYYAEQAGREFAETGKFSELTQNKLNELILPPKVFVEAADASWQINEPAKNSNQDDKSYNYMRQMAAVYNPQSYAKDAVIEFHFADINKTYQLWLEKEKCILKTDDFMPYTTRIETTFDLWNKISEGKANGAAAMMKKQCRVLGDFNTMLRMNDYFGTKKSIPKAEPKTNMNILLIQWIILWVLLPINKTWAGIAGVIVCSIIPVLTYKFKLTIYDKTSIIMVSALSVLALLNISLKLIVCLSYLLFGLMWILSCLAKIPLTAYYSSNDYNGDEAFANPLFIKTNKILTLAWGMLYLIIAIYSYFLMSSAVAKYIGLINLLAPLLMGLFTAWFAKWYPERIARG